MQPSQNVEDRRGMRPGLGMGGMGIRMGGLGLGGLLVLMVLGYFFTGDPLGLMDSGSGGAPPAETGARGTPSDEAGDRIARVLGDTERTWGELFAQQNRSYRPPTLVLFSDAAESACGFSSSATGPFYCPGDQKLYIDLSFFMELDRRFGAPGDFAQAYVVAHEVGHHVQNLLGVFDQVRGMQRSRGDANALSVRQELMADCFAGIWGHYAASRGLLETGDVEEGLTAAAAIGDDQIQRRTQGRVTPESWTHGSSAERVRWFRQGLESGQIRSCDTFAG
jgi:predicted metalloprotease